MLSVVTGAGGGALDGASPGAGVQDGALVEVLPREKSSAVPSGEVGVVVPVPSEPPAMSTLPPASATATAPSRGDCSSVAPLAGSAVKVPQDGL